MTLNAVVTMPALLLCEAPLLHPLPYDTGLQYDP